MRLALKALGLICLATKVAGQTAFVTCQPGEALSLIDVSTGTEAARWPLPGKPAGVAVSGDKIYTVSPDSKVVRRLGHDGAVQAEVTLGGGPTGIAVDAARGRVFVSDWYNARLWVLSADDLSPIGELATGASPAGIALSPDARHLASADKDANKISLFDAETLVPLGVRDVGIRPYGLSFAPDGRLFVGNVGSNDVTVLDVEADATVATIPVGERPYGVAFASGRAFVTNQYSNTVSVIDLGSLATIATIGVGEYPEGIDATADGRHLVLANWFDNTVSIVDASTHNVVHEIDTCDGPRAFGVFIRKGEKQ